MNLGTFLPCWHHVRSLNFNSVNAIFYLHSYLSSLLLKYSKRHRTKQLYFRLYVVIVKYINLWLVRWRVCWSNKCCFLFPTATNTHCKTSTVSNLQYVGPISSVSLPLGQIPMTSTQLPQELIWPIMFSTLKRFNLSLQCAGFGKCPVLWDPTFYLILPVPGGTGFLITLLAKRTRTGWNWMNDILWKINGLIIQKKQSSISLLLESQPYCPYKIRLLLIDVVPSFVCELH